MRPAETAKEDDAARSARWKAFAEQLREGLEIEGEGPPFTRDEMHER